MAFEWVDDEVARLKAQQQAPPASAWSDYIKPAVMAPLHVLGAGYKGIGTLATALDDAVRTGDPLSLSSFKLTPEGAQGGLGSDAASAFGFGQTTTGQKDPFEVAAGGVRSAIGGLGPGDVDPQWEQAFRAAAPKTTGAEAAGTLAGQFTTQAVLDPVLHGLGALGARGAQAAEAAKGTYNVLPEAVTRAIPALSEVSKGTIPKAIQRLAPETAEAAARGLGAAFVPGMAISAAENLSRAPEAIREHGFVSPETVETAGQGTVDALFAGLGAYHGLRGHQAGPGETREEVKEAQEEGATQTVPAVPPVAAPLRAPYEAPRITQREDLLAITPEEQARLDALNHELEAPPEFAAALRGEALPVAEPQTATPTLEDAFRQRQAAATQISPEEFVDIPDDLRVRSTYEDILRRARSEVAAQPHQTIPPAPDLGTPLPPGATEALRAPATQVAAVDLAGRAHERSKVFRQQSPDLEAANLIYQEAERVANEANKRGAAGEPEVTAEDVLSGKQPIKISGPKKLGGGLEATTPEAKRGILAALAARLIRNGYLDEGVVKQSIREGIDSGKLVEMLQARQANRGLTRSSAAPRTPDEMAAAEAASHMEAGREGGLPEDVAGRPAKVLDRPGRSREEIIARLAAQRAQRAEEAPVPDEDKLLAAIQKAKARPVPETTTVEQPRIERSAPPAPQARDEVEPVPFLDKNDNPIPDEWFLSPEQAKKATEMGLTQETAELFSEDADVFAEELGKMDARIRPHLLGLYRKFRATDLAPRAGEGVHAVLRGAEKSAVPELIVDRDTPIDKRYTTVAAPRRETPQAYTQKSELPADFGVPKGPSLLEKMAARRAAEAPAEETKAKETSPTSPARPKFVDPQEQKAADIKEFFGGFGSALRDAAIKKAKEIADEIRAGGDREELERGLSQVWKDAIANQLGEPQPMDPASVAKREREAAAHRAAIEKSNRDKFAAAPEAAHTPASFESLRARLHESMGSAIRAVTEVPGADRSAGRAGIDIEWRNGMRTRILETGDIIPDLRDVARGRPEVDPRSQVIRAAYSERGIPAGAVIRLAEGKWSLTDANAELLHDAWARLLRGSERKLLTDRYAKELEGRLRAAGKEVTADALEEEAVHKWAEEVTKWQEQAIREGQVPKASPGWFKRLWDWVVRMANALRAPEFNRLTRAAAEGGLWERGRFERRAGEVVDRWHEETHVGEVQRFAAEVAGANTPAEIAAARKAWKEQGIASPWFRRWFGGSKVVDGANGQALPVYRGGGITSGTATNFKTEGEHLGGFSKHPTAKLGIFFTTSPQVAAMFTPSYLEATWEKGIAFKRTFEPGANVKQVFLRIENPFVLTPKEFTMLTHEPANGGGWRGEPFDPATMRADLIREGYDGIRIKADEAFADRPGGAEFEADQWVIFSPNQAKSATGNRGTFNLANSDIRYSSAVEVARGRFERRAGDVVDAARGVLGSGREGEKFASATRVDPTEPREFLNKSGLSDADQFEGDVAPWVHHLDRGAIGRDDFNPAPPAEHDIAVRGPDGKWRTADSRNLFRPEDARTYNGHADPSWPSATGFFHTTIKSVGKPPNWWPKDSSEWDTKATLGYLNERIPGRFVIREEPHDYISTQPGNWLSYEAAGPSIFGPTETLSVPVIRDVFEPFFAAQEEAPKGEKFAASPRTDTSATPTASAPEAAEPKLSDLEDAVTKAKEELASAKEASRAARGPAAVAAAQRVRDANKAVKAAEEAVSKAIPRVDKDRPPLDIVGDAPGPHAPVKGAEGPTSLRQVEINKIYTNEHRASLGLAPVETWLGDVPESHRSLIPQVLEYIRTHDYDRIFAKKHETAVTQLAQQAVRNGLRADIEALQKQKAEAEAKGKDSGSINQAAIVRSLELKIAQIHEMGAKYGKRYTEMRTDLARALAAGNSILNAGPSLPDRFLRSVFKKIKGISPEHADFISDIVHQGKFEALPDAIQAALKPTWWNKFLEAWKNGLVSAPGTLVFANPGGNIGEAIARIAETPFGVATDALASALGHGERVRTFGEVGAEASAIHAAARPAADTLASDLRNIFKGKYGDLFGLEEGKAHKAIHEMLEYPPAIGPGPEWIRKLLPTGHLGKTIRIPVYILGATDNFFRTLGTAAELGKLSHRQAVKELGRGADKQTLALKAQEIMAAARDAKSGKYQELMAKAEDAAVHRVFQSDAPSLRGFESARANIRPFGIPIGHLAVPFARTPFNIFRIMMERSPIGAVGAGKAWFKFEQARKEGKLPAAEVEKLRENALDLTARAALGSAMFTLFLSGAKAGLMTGAGPTDPKAKKALMETGWQPYSFKIGDRYIPFNRFEPVSSILGFSADAVEIAHKSDKESFLRKTAAAFMTNALSKTYLQGLSDAASIIVDPERYGPEYAAQLAGSLVPNIVAKGAQAIDPVMRETRPPGGGPLGQIGATIQSRVPGASTFLPEQKTLTGETRERPNAGSVAGALGRFALPVQVTSRKAGSELQEEFARVGYTPPVPDRKLRVSGQDIVLAPGEQDRLAEEYRKASERARKLLTSPAYRAAPDEAEGAGRSKRKMLQQIFEDANSRFKARYAGILRARARDAHAAL